MAKKIGVVYQMTVRKALNNVQCVQKILAISYEYSSVDIS